MTGDAQAAATVLRRNQSSRRERAVLFRERLDCRRAPLDAALALRGEEHAFALLGQWAGGGALIGSRPTRVVAGPAELFAALDEQPIVDQPATVGGAVGGGWFGFLGFNLARKVERLNPPPPARVALPAGELAYYDHLIRFDSTGQWWFEALVTPDRRAAILARRDELLIQLAQPPDRRPFASTGWRWDPTARGHAAVVRACQERIRRGDLFQANLTMRLEGRLEGEALDLFATAAGRLPTERAAYITGPWGSLASLSPELFLERHRRLVRTAPIKGTRPAGGRDELARSEKDRAENVMIVDLMRNDLGRVCSPGTIRVPALAEVRAHAGVWHLVSEVEGMLEEGVGDAELLRATFPPGSVTGAPKIAALNVIAELESSQREAYTGAIGFASPAAGLELSVAIRTFEICGDRIWLGAGGGIVADSVPEDEAREAAAKAAPLLAAIGTEPPAQASSSARPQRPHRRHGRPTPRPDPEAGLYETIRVLDGAAQRLAAHLARLTESMRSLYRLTPPAELASEIAALARGVSDGRLRIDVVPGDAPLVELTPLPVLDAPVLRPVVVPGGLGAHKWRDRRLLVQFESDHPSTLPLLVDADGFILETSRAGIIVQAADGTLYTPPTDGRILPSVTVAASRAVQRPLTLADLRHARGIFVASALRGCQAAALTAHAAPAQK